VSKGEETRAAIVATALALVSEAGLEGASIGALAERMKMSKSGLFAHFGTKENLHVAVLDEAARRFVEMVVAPALKKPRGEPRVRALFEGWLDWPKAVNLPGGCIFAAVTAELDDRPGPARDRLVGIQRDLLDTFSTAARIAVEEGHFRRDLDTKQFAFEIYALAFGALFVARLLKDPKAESRVRTAFERLVRDARKEK
jgi:AcrR family transcriptional regulator